MDKLYKIYEKYNIYFIKYVFAGGFCAIINWYCFYVFNSYYHINYLISGVLAFAISNLINFILCKLIFKSKGLRKRIEFLLVTLASSIAIIVDLTIMSICIKFFNITPIYSKMAGTAVAFIFNYLLRQFLIFDRDNKIK